MFTDRTSLLDRNPIQRNYGVAVSNVAGDETFQVIVASYSGANLVLQWDGRRFVETADPVVQDRDRQAIGVAAADVDGDGCEEIYVLNTDTFAGPKRFSDRLFDESDGWVNLFESTDNVPARNLLAGRSVACVDRTGDGRYGFFVASYGGPMRLYEVSDAHRLRDVASDAGIDLTTGGRGVVALPLVSGRMDIFCTNERGPNFLFANQGDGTYAEVASARGLGDRHEHGRGVDVVDVGDARGFGLIYGNWEGRHRLFVPQDGGTYCDVTPPPMAAPSRVRSIIAADFDNDGYEEIFFNNIGQPNRLFAQENGTWSEVDAGDAREPEGLGTGAAVGDFDGDGTLELVVSHGEAGAQPLTLYHALPHHRHHFLRVLPRTRHGAPARGAVVTCTAEGRTQRRNVDAGSAYLCQMEPVAHFGLGRAKDVESVTIYWPDGTHRTLDHPAADEVHDVAHP